MMNIEERRVVVKPTKALENISLDKHNPEKSTRIRANLKEKIKKDLVRFLRENIDVFAWNHKDMPGIDLSVITQRLNVYSSSNPM